MGILVLDFGGSAVKYGFWDGAALHHQSKFVTAKTWEEMKKQLDLVYQEILEKETILGIGISAPGVVNSDKQVIEGISAIPYIHGFNIFEELSTRFGVPVSIENDANCAGMAEYYEGAAKDFDSAAFVVIGTGIGGALFIDGKMIKGAHLYGGEFGLMFLDKDHTFSERGTAVQMAWRYCKRRGLDKNTYSGQEVFAFAEQGDDLAKEEVEIFWDSLVKGLFSIQFSFDPEIIVLGGGVSAKEGMIDEINQRMKKLTDHFNLNDFTPNIVVCDYRNDANLIGAAANFEKEIH